MRSHSKGAGCCCSRWESRRRVQRPSSARWPPFPCRLRRRRRPLRGSTVRVCTTGSASAAWRPGCMSSRCGCCVSRLSSTMRSASTGGSADSSRKRCMAAEPGPGRIQARLSTFDTSMVVFSLVVGIGIFRTPAIVAGAAGDTTLFFTAWIAGGLVSLIGALVFAEIGSRYPRAGGYYRVVADCYHPTLAFMLNWSQTLMQGAGAAGVAFIGADYLIPVLLPPQWRTPHASLAFACATMLILLTLNYRGVKPGARVQNLLSVAKIAMIVGLALLALLLAPRAG